MSEIKQLFKRAFTMARREEGTPARLGDGNGNLFPIPGRNDIAWARLQRPGSVTLERVNVSQVTAAHGAPVLVREDRNGDLEAYGSDPSEASRFWAEFGKGNVPAHQDTHQYLGPDVLFMDSRQLKPLQTRLLATPGLSVYLEPLVYPFGKGQAWNGDEIDLTSYVPGGDGQQRFVITGLNTGSNTPEVFASTVTSFTYVSGTIPYVPFTLLEVARLAYGHENYMPSMAVRLYGGMTSLERYDLFADCRNWLEVPGRKHNYAATSTPTTSDDASQGYQAGSTWYHISTGNVYLCVDNTTGAAVWRLITGGGEGTGGNEFETVFAQGTGYQHSLNSSGLLLSRQNNTASAAPFLFLDRYRDDTGAPDDVLQNDYLSEIYHRGYAGGGLRDAAIDRVSVIEPTPSATAMGAQKDELVTPLAAIVPVVMRTVTAAAGNVLKQPTAGNPVSGQATNGIQHETCYQNRVTTTNNTQTTLHTFTVPSSSTYFIEAHITARRTGGTAGSAEDGAAYVVRGVFKNVAGTATLIGSVSTTDVGEDQAGWDATFTVTGATVLCRVTGATDNNITWDMTARVFRTG